jgi:hypothetical protein
MQAINAKHEAVVLALSGCWDDGMMTSEAMHTAEANVAGLAAGNLDG